MSDIKVNNDIIPSKTEGEEEMPEPTYIHCPICKDKTSREAQITLMCNGPVGMRGIMKCLRCQHEWPFTMERNCLQQIDTALPGEQSSRLNPSVPEDIKEDIKEAERAYYAQCYKACVAMCRRALQLALIDKNIKDNRLSAMLEEANKTNLLNGETYIAAKSIKVYGDIGTHRREYLDPRDINMAIYIAVKMLNEMFP